MLLVNWKESKSLDRQKAYKTWAWIALCSCLCVSFKANSAPQSLSNPTSIVSIFLSLLLVIGVVFMLAFLMRRFNVTQSGTSNLKVVASMMAGAKERVMVIEVAGEQHLLGITAHNINHLATLSTPIDTSTGSSGNEKFKDKLSLFMAGKINPAMAQNSKTTKTQREES
ncbi:flagellar biosynthetic protein FliO [uncultured Paraglaciecola sp.]|jgi:flagellar protein FliO/FliZ|uniref:flagellar biosynthetic protein FliO n=1 Tax=uncultured Paraglaciecola sp. TaxID=1765024 RepID=UPI0025FFBF4D|nr:flagellar biosynthetic protein FliO [uncultured Paraglaciecola sp.]